MDGRGVALRPAEGHDLVSRVLALRGTAGAMGLEKSRLFMLTQEQSSNGTGLSGEGRPPFCRGRLVAGVGKIVGRAASHAVLSVATERGWRDASHRALTEAAESLASKAGNQLIASNFSAARLYRPQFLPRCLWNPMSGLPTDPKSTTLWSKCLAMRREGG